MMIQPIVQAIHTMRSISVTALGAAGSLVLVALAWAGAPVAVVEDVNGKSAGVEFMDYVAAGQVIRLGPRDTIVLGYLKSCWRETITGGTVTVGTEQSDVQHGKVERIQVKCDGGGMQLSAAQAVQSAGDISRGVGTPGKQADAPQPQITLYGRVPMIEVGGGGTLAIERIDQPDERYEIAIDSRELVRGLFFDVARARRVLSAGGLYRAKFGAKQIVFKVDPAALASAPVVARLLRF
jgi:hypothetical protein